MADVIAIGRKLARLAHTAAWLGEKHAEQRRLAGKTRHASEIT